MQVEQKQKKLVVPVEVYSRVVGYFRPVNQWNKGKQAEFHDRVCFVLPKEVAITNGDQTPMICRDIAGRDFEVVGK